MSAVETTSCVRKGLRRRHGASGSLASAAGVHLSTHDMMIWAGFLIPYYTRAWREPVPTSGEYDLELRSTCLQASTMVCSARTHSICFCTKVVFQGSMSCCSPPWRQRQQQHGGAGCARFQGRRVEELYKATVLGAAVAKALAVHKEGTIVCQQAQRRQQMPQVGSKASTGEVVDGAGPALLA